MNSSLKYSFLLLTLLSASCSFQNFLGLRPSSPPGDSLTKPHTVCADCHGTEQPPQGAPKVARGATPSTPCLACHDYKKNHHPVDFAPVNPASIPFPLFDGKITCLTCHAIHSEAGKEGARKLLRGGSSQDRRQICIQCHMLEKYSGVDPHAMLTEGKKVREVNGQPVCLLCHSNMPDPEADLTDNVRFRADIGFLCWRCHPPMSGPFFNTHFLVAPSEKTLDRIHTAETGSNVIMPLIPRGRITCSTCHNPHQQGVLQREAAARGADSKAKLRLPEAPCSACHTF